MTVSAAETRDPNGRPLAFHWRLLQGDPDRVAIEPLGGRHQRDDHPRLARPLPHLRGQPASPRPASTSASSPRTASTTAPRRSSAGTSPRPRRAATEPGPDGDPAHRRDRPRRTPAAPTPTRSSSPAPTGATTSPTTPSGALARLDPAARRPAAPRAFNAEGRRLPEPGRPGRHVRSRCRGRLPAVAREPTAGSWSRRSMPPRSELIARPLRCAMATPRPAYTSSTDPEEARRPDMPPPDAARRRPSPW